MPLKYVIHTAYKTLRYSSP